MATPWTRKSHSEYEWATQRLRITDLYRIQDYPLKDVMQIMARKHGFYASPKMYKNHITEWGIDKNNKVHEAQAIMAEKQKRDASDQQCLFFVRKFLVDLDSMERFFRRSRSSRSQTNGPLPADVQVLVLRNGIRNLNDPSNFKALRGFFHYYGVLVESSFERGLWVNNSLDILDTDTLVSATIVEQSFLDLNTACQLFVRNDHQKGGIYLRASFWRFGDLLQSTYHETIPCLIQSLTELQRHSLHKVVEEIVRHLNELAEVMLPAGHPYRALLMALKQIKIDASGELLDAQSVQRRQLYLRELSDDHLTVIGLGRFRYTASGQKSDHRSRTQIRTALNNIDNKCGRAEPSALSELDSICAGLYAAERLEEAETAYEMLNKSLGKVTYVQWVWKTLEASYRLGEIKYRRHKLAAAKEVWDRAAELAGCLVQAHEYYWMPKLLEALSDVSLDLGDPQAAAGYRQKLDDLRARVLQQAENVVRSPTTIYDSGGGTTLTSMSQD